MCHFPLKLEFLMDFAEKKKEKKKKNASKCAALQLNRVQALFSRMYRRMYNSNKFRSFTD